MRARALPLAVALRGLGYAPELLLPPWDSPRDAGHTVVEGGVPVHHVLAGNGGWAAQVLQASALARAALAIQPPILHAFKPIGGAGLALLLLARARRAGLWRGHIVVDADDWEGRGGWAERNRGPLGRWLVAWQEQWALRQADAVTVASRALETIAWSLGRSPASVRYLPNGVAEVSAEPPARGARPRLLLYSRLLEVAPERAAALAAAVLRLASDSQLLLLGDAAERERRFRRALAALAPGANWHHQPYSLAAAREALGSDLVALFPLDDTLVNRTKCPARLAETLAAGQPVVAEAVGESVAYLDGGRCGLLVAPRDHAALVEGTARLLGDAEARTRLGELARQRMAQGLLWRQLGRHLAHLYGELLGGTTSTTAR